MAQHYDAIRMDDDLIGEILTGLRDVGLDQNTIVVYFSDHGANNLLRHKQMTTEGGLHVPFMVMGPESYVPKSQIRQDLVDLLDLSATTLAWAIEQPSWYEGQYLFAADFKPRSYVGSHKDRLDHTIDRVPSQSAAIHFATFEKLQIGSYFSSAAISGTKRTSHKTA